MTQSVKLIISLVVAAIVLFAAWQTYMSWSGLKEELAAAEQSRDEAITERDDLLTRSKAYEDARAKLQASIDTKDAQIKEHEGRIVQLQGELESANKKVARTIDEQEIADLFRTAYDETRDNVKVVSLPEVTGSGRVFRNTFLAVPIDLAKAQIDAKNAETSCFAQMEEKDAILGLHADIRSLQNEQLGLYRREVLDWREGYGTLYDRFVTTN